MHVARYGWVFLSVTSSPREAFGLLMRLNGSFGELQMMWSQQTYFSAQERHFYLVPLAVQRVTMPLVQVTFTQSSVGYGMRERLAIRDASDFNMVS